jgi:hypothetical protein
MSAVATPPTPKLQPHYIPNYARYSRAPGGYHDEPFEYVFSFQGSITLSQVPPRQADLLNQPLHFDPDADFYMRGIGFLLDQSAGVEGDQQATFDVRLRDSFGRPLDNDYIAMQCYATQVFITQVFFAFIPPGSFPISPWYPELYCPANSFMFGDFRAQNNLVAPAATLYSFHVYMSGVKRFPNAECQP